MISFMLQPLYPQRKNALCSLNRRMEGYGGDRSRTFRATAKIGKRTFEFELRRWNRVISVGQTAGTVWDGEMSLG